MKSKYQFVSIAILFFIPFSQMYSQEWMKNVKEGEKNFYTIQKEFQQYYDGREPEREEEGEEAYEEMMTEGWMLYKRWEWFWSPRVYPTGKLPRPDILEMRMKEFAQIQSPQKSGAANWTIIGPSVVPSNAGGAGRVNCVVVNPSNSSIIFIGSAGGGLWKSTNNGSSWTTTTDALGSIGVTAIAFDPNNINIMYLATGDADAGDTYSIGVLKSTDGGGSWNSTGLNYTVNQTTTVRALVTHPTNSNIIFATTNTGIYRTTDAGTNWSSVASGSFRDLEINKSDPNILYATINSDGIYKSTNGGTSFSKLTTGLPTSSFGRIGIAIAPSSPANVYALYVNTTNGFYGLYKTTDAGANWTQQSNTPNILSWDGTGTNGQGWYDLVIDVDPNNASTIYTGGVNMYKSTTSGTSWTKITHWYSDAGYPYIHADQHGMTFLPGSSTTFFVGNDGGIFKTTDAGTSWSDLSNGLAITQFYRLGSSATNVNRIYAGAQDNGTDRVLNGNWTRIIGGDGMEALIDYSDENYGYGELYYGAIKRTTNGGSSFSSITSGIGEDGGWVTPYVINPVNPRSLYLGTTKIYKTLNRGTSWSAISSILNGGTFVALAVAPSDTNTIYASTSSSIYKTTNNGGAWSSITTGLPVGSITYLAVQPNNAQVLYATFSGYSNQKVYKTTNGGTNWTNISTGLPSIPINCVTVHPVVPNEIWVGTDVGVYHSSTSGNTWEQFSTNLPNVVVNELEVHLASSKLRAATYGRGIWETPITVNNTSIAGMKFNDMNGNGVKDAGETGLANWKIKITGAATDSILTSSSGEYIFSNLNAGTYTVSEVQKSGWSQTAPFGGTYSVTLSSGQAVTGKDFGNRPIGNMSGMKFKDANGNGIKDVGETGLANWKIKINGTYADSVLTDMNGNYSFIITQAGTFSVSEVQQSGWIQTMPAGGTYSLSFTNGNSYTNIDFGNKTAPLASLSPADFEDGNVPPPNWTLNNPDNDYTWTIYNTSGYGVGAQSAKFDFYNYSAIGQIDEMVTPTVTGYLDSDTLLFDYAYAEYSASYVDSFRVQMSLDGGNTFPVSLFYAWSAALATAPTTTSAFVPTSTQWKTQRISLGAQVVGQNVVLKFKTINGYGNSFYLDNVRIKSGVVLYGSASGMKFNDVNGNGVKDAGESGIANWKIKISGMKNDSTVTDGSGNFYFNNLVNGNYTLAEVQQNGWMQTFPVSPATYSFLISNGNNVTGKNFGNTQYSSIAGNVFNDANNNGIKDAGELNLTGWKIKLSGAKNDSLNTDVNGNYSFINLLVGNYIVTEVVQNNWIVTVPPSPFTYAVAITSGNTVVTAKNFGNFLGGSVYGNIFHDNNGNGVKDNGESGIQNWKVKITGTKNDSTNTDASGNYAFLGLMNGSYSISEVLSNGWYQTLPVNPATYAVAVVAGGNVFTNKNFGVTQFSSVSGTLFIDNNGNGVKDVGEISASNRKLKLIGSSTDSSLSDENGNYVFQYLKAGNYTLAITLPNDWMPTLPVSSMYSLLLGSGNNFTDKHFGIFQYAAVTGNVFEDMNGNGTKENGDNNLQGWKIFLNGTRDDSAITDANGNYSFGNIAPGNYSVAEQIISDWTRIAPSSSYTITPSSGNIFAENNFANYHNGKIAGTVFNDFDADMVMDDEESPIVNAKVYLIAANNSIADSATTDANGYYVFSFVMSGEKKVAAKIVTGNAVIISLNTITATFSSGSNFTGKNLSLFYPATISGFKFHDKNGDGNFNADDNGLSNVAMYLGGTASDTVQTDETGFFSFENVGAGTYNVTAAIQFANGIASTLAKNITPTSGGNFTNNNFGEFKPAQIEVSKFLDNDGNIATVNDQIEKQWNLYLYKSSDADSLIAATNSSAMIANNLKPGNYAAAEYDSSDYELLAVYNGTSDVTASATGVLNNQIGKFVFSIYSGDSVRIRYVNHYKDTAQFRTFSVSTAFSEKSNKLSEKNRHATIANVRDTVVKRLGGLILGLQQTNVDSAKIYGWIRWKSGSDVAKFFTSAHTGKHYPFDSIRIAGKKTKLFIKELKPTRKSYNNPLAEEFAVFKMNVAASSYGTLPIGFDELEYHNEESVFDGMKLVEIVPAIDALLTRWKNNGINYDYTSVYTMLHQINGAFTTTIADSDIVSISPLVFDGDIMLRDRAFLKRSDTPKSHPAWLHPLNETTIPEQAMLLQNYPNPFNPTTAIGFSFLADGNVTLKVYDVLGREVATLLDNERMGNGEYEVIFNANELTSGMYFYRLSVNSEKGNYSETKKLLLLK